MEMPQIKQEPASEEENHSDATSVKTIRFGEQEVTVLTREDLKKLAAEKMKEFLNDEKKNPLLSLRKRADELIKNIEDCNQEYLSLARTAELIAQDHEKFLRKGGFLPKVQTRTIGVNVKITPIKEYENMQQTNKNYTAPISRHNLETNDTGLIIGPDRLQTGMKAQLPSGTASGYRSLVHVGNLVNFQRNLSSSGNAASPTALSILTATDPRDGIQKPRSADSTEAARMIRYSRQLAQPNILQRSRVAYPPETNLQWQQ